MTFRTTFLLLLISSALNADCSRILEYGAPVPSGQLDIIDIEMCKSADELLIGYDYTTNQARWVGAFMTLEGTRDSRYSIMSNEEDMELPDFARTTLGDYRGTGCEKLHLTLSGSIKGTRSEYLLSNVSPSSPAFARGAWSSINDKMRRQVKVSGALVIYAGPIFTKPTRRIGASRILLPTHFYKIAYAPREQRMWAYILPNRAIKKQNVVKWVATVDEIEESTGIDFFSRLPNVLETRLEKRKEFLR